ncbi:MBL fold metallo-hydrolase [Pseudonocardia sp. NPDC049635]|uniref:MBL fold metallo-hydrolase n=1 Tax=Pseudonocardia sp. NPDC049635 TaxID=3155506 RepID=UPI00340D8A5B
MGVRTEFGELTEVARDVYAYVQPDGGWMINNTGLYRGGGEWVLIDTTSTEARNRAMFGAMTAVVGMSDPAALINTHHHGDHTYGNWMVPATSPVIARTRCRHNVIDSGLASMERMPEPDYGHVEVRPPSATFEGEMTLELANTHVELISLPTGHTTGDVAVWLPEQRVLFAGDLIFNGGHPFVLDGSLSGYRTALDKLRTLEPEVVVPGHGPVCRDAAAAEVIEALDMYAERLLQHAIDCRARGLEPGEAAREFDYPAATGWGESERVVGNLYRAYHELEGNEPGSRLDREGATQEMRTIGGRMRSFA